MYYILIAIHVISCVFLIVTILLQAGRGGGLTEAFSGSTQSVLGTQAPRVLKKATEISAIVFLIMSLLLAMVTSRRGRSLFQQMKVPVGPGMPYQGQSAPGPAAATDASDIPVTDEFDDAAPLAEEIPVDVPAAGQEQ